MPTTRGSIASGLSVVATVALLGVLGYYLTEPGFTWIRVAFFAVLGGLAVAGSGGIWYRRTGVAVGAAFGLFLLGFFQAVLWIYLLPVAAILVVSALLVSDSEGDDTRVREEA